MIDVEIIIRDLLNILGLYIKEDGRIYDEDTMSCLIYNGGYLYLNKSNSYSTLMHKNDCIFNPISNNKLAKYLFTILLKKESDDNGLYVRSMSSSPHPDKDALEYAPYRIDLYTNKGDFCSEYFYMESLQYINLMYIITGTPLLYNLKKFDLTKDEIKDLRNKKG